jgi:DNA-binding transcriptional LysR family regulator
MTEFSTSRITLDQWRAMVAVVDAGTYAKAADALHKSQSSVTYAVQKMQELLGVQAFEIHGRRAVLTPTGELLYRRARLLLDEAERLERAARKASAGWESEITLAVEVVFPTWLVLECLNAFGEESPQTRIELVETVTASGPGSLLDALLEGRVDLVL